MTIPPNSILRAGSESELWELIDHVWIDGTRAGCEKEAADLVWKIGEAGTIGGIPSSRGTANDIAGTMGYRIIAAICCVWSSA